MRYGRISVDRDVKIYFEKCTLWSHYSVDCDV